MQTITPEQEVHLAINDTQYETLPVKQKPRAAYLALKRGIDILVALVVSTILLLPMILIGVIIKLESKGPAIFKQKRMGKDGKVFTIFKFRTMKQSAPSEMATRDFVDANQYMTKFGNFLRRSSIDELPQLLNILTGDMSFVGYRPVCLTETDLNELRMERGVFWLRPGITGLAQVSGRDDIGYEKKVELDAEYVAKCSLKLDLWCLLQTVRTVITGEGVY